METKVCKRCGHEQPLSEFRHYYGNRKGYYSFCKTCERIEQRHKYLVGKGESLTDAERMELEKINLLYERRRAAGLAAPDRRSPGGITNLLDALLKEVEEST